MITLINQENGLKKEVSVEMAEAILKHGAQFPKCKSWDIEGDLYTFVDNNIILKAKPKKNAGQNIEEKKVIGPELQDESTSIIG